MNDEEKYSDSERVRQGCQATQKFMRYQAWDVHHWQILVAISTGASECCAHTHKHVSGYRLSPSFIPLFSPSSSFLFFFLHLLSLLHCHSDFPIRFLFLQLSFPLSSGWLLTFTVLSPGSFKELRWGEGRSVSHWLRLRSETHEGSWRC